MDSSLKRPRTSDLNPLQSDELLESFFAEAAIGLSINDLEGRFIRANPAYCALTGFSEAELTKRDFRDLTHPDDLLNTQNELAALISGKKSSVQIEDRCVSKNAGVIWTRNTFSVIRDQTGQPVGLVRVTEDITERRKLEENLRVSEERHRELFENAREAIYVHDLGGRYTSFNRAAERLSGYSREEILGKHFSNFVAPGSLRAARQNLCRKLDDMGETIYEIELITKDRRRIPVEVSSRLIYENGEPIGVQGVARDITDRRRAQEALQTYARPLIQAQEAERQHIARELHDEIGHVLTAVRINLQSLEDSASGGVQSPIQESLQIVDEALGRVRELSLNLRPSLLDDLGLSSALRWYVDRYARRSGVVADLQSDLEEGRRFGVELETACFRIVQEALTNIARHARATHVQVCLTCSNESLDLKVTDDGLGFNVEALIKDAPPSMTLGLRGMEERAVAVHGLLSIESAPMQGTEVRASFPLAQTA